MTPTREALLRLCKHTGLFRLSRRLHARDLTILCYHGFSIHDEHAFRPGLFMRAERFARRLSWLLAQGYRFLPLEEGVRRLQNGTLPRCSAVITIDDGFFSTYSLALPVLARLRLPATVYVTTYYVRHPNPVFELLLYYLLWKTTRARLDAADLAPLREALPTKGPQSEVLADALLAQAERLTEDGRVALAQELARRLDVDYAELRDSRRLSLMNEEELRAMARAGVDLQLHSHRHRLPCRMEEVAREIGDNRRVLEPITGKRLRHFCYPSGRWSTGHWELLRACGIETATTCDLGLNDPRAQTLALRRVLDDERVSQIAFEAEVCGFKDFARNTLRRHAPHAAAAPATPVRS